jgi:F-type H+-transporting ATPase subunit alpha
VAIFLGTRGHLDTVPVQDVTRFEAEFLDHVRHNVREVLDEIRESKKLSDDGENKLAEAVKEFKKGFSTSDGSSVVEADAEAMDAEDEGKESVKVNKPAPKKS